MRQPTEFRVGAGAQGSRGDSWPIRLAGSAAVHGAAGRGSSSGKYGSVGRRAASALLFGMPKHPAPPRPRHRTCYQRPWRLQWGGPGMRAARCRPLGDSLEAMPAAGRFAWSERHQQTYRCPGAPSRIAVRGRGCTPGLAAASTGALAGNQRLVVAGVVSRSAFRQASSARRAGRGSESPLRTQQLW